MQEHINLVTMQEHINHVDTSSGGQELPVPGDADAEGAGSPDELRSFKGRYSELVAQYIKICGMERKKNMVGHLTFEGGQELIEIFGVDRLFEVLADQARKDRAPNMHEIIKILEPDKKKRAALYDRMTDSVQAKRHELQQHGDTDHGYYEFRPDHNNLNIRDASIGAYRAMDALTSRIMDALGRVSSDKFIVESHAHLARRQGAIDHEKYAELREKLKSCGDDLAALVKILNDEAEYERNLLRDSIVRLDRDIEDVMGAIADEIHAQVSNEKETCEEELYAEIDREAELKFQARTAPFKQLLQTTLSIKTWPMM